MFLGGLPALGAAFVPSGSASCCPQPSFPGGHPPAPQKAVRCSEGVGGADSRAGSAPGPRLSPGEGAGLTSRPVFETLEAEEQGEGTSHPGGGGRSAPAAVWWGLAGAAPASGWLRLVASGSDLHLEGAALWDALSTPLPCHSPRSSLPATHTHLGAGPASGSSSPHRPVLPASLPRSSSCWSASTSS